MNGLKKNSDLISFIIVVVGGVFIILNSIHKVDLKLSQEISNVRSELSHEISLVNNEIVKIQTVLIIKEIVPTDLFSTDFKEE